MAFTFFFRDNATLEKIARDVIPALVGARSIRIWDAGCATGAEPYSLAIILREACSVFMYRRLSILATDHDPTDQFGPIVRAGVYTHDEIARIPETLRHRYFQQIGDDRFQVIDEIRSHVTFLKHDLLTLTPPLSPVDVVVCKNVLLHFDQQSQCDAMRMFHAVLTPTGALACERTQKMPEPVAPLFRTTIDQARLFRKNDLKPSCEAPMMSEATCSFDADDSIQSKATSVVTAAR